MHFNQTGQSWLTADFNGDGKVNALDFNAIAANFGSGSVSGAGLDAVVPEPQLGFILLGGAVIFRKRRSQPRQPAVIVTAKSYQRLC